MYQLQPFGFAKAPLPFLLQKFDSAVARFWCRVTERITNIKKSGFWEGGLVMVRFLDCQVDTTDWGMQVDA